MSPSTCLEISSNSSELKDLKSKEKKLLRIGVVPEHFSAPLFLLDEQSYLDPHSTQYKTISMPCGTGEMISALENKDIDISVSLMEGIVAKAINQRLDSLSNREENLQDSFLTIMGSYISSPLTWSIAVATESNFTHPSQLCKIGISRYGSGSHIMAIVLGMHLGISFEFVVCGSITGLLQAVQEGKTDAFLWEVITTKPYYDEGKVKMLDTLTAPWPAFIFASTLSSSKLHKSGMAGLFSQTIQSISQFTSEFESKGRSYILTSPHFHYKNVSDLNDWFRSTRFTSNVSLMKREMLQGCIDTLIKAGVVDGEKIREWEKVKNRNMVQEICNSDFVDIC